MLSRQGLVSIIIGVQFMSWGLRQQVYGLGYYVRCLTLTKITKVEVYPTYLFWRYFLSCPERRPNKAVTNFPWRLSPRHIAPTTAYSFAVGRGPMPTSSPLLRPTNQAEHKPALCDPPVR